MTIHRLFLTKRKTWIRSSTKTSCQTFIRRWIWLMIKVLRLILII